MLITVGSLVSRATVSPVDAFIKGLDGTKEKIKLTTTRLYIPRGGRLAYERGGNA